MSLRCASKIVVALCIICSVLIAEEPCYVGLGSNCEVAFMIRKYTNRTEAYPFDWMLTLDHPKFILALEEDLAYFTDLQYLYFDYFLMHSRYHIQFRHDCESNRDFANTCYEEMVPRYARRVERFWNVDNHQGKVYFIRGPVKSNDIGGDKDPAWYPNCTFITPQDASELHQVLKKKFPHCDFTLVIINYPDELPEPFPLMEGIQEFKVRKDNRDHDFERVFNALR